MPKSHHILNAASNLLGISLIIITGLRLSGRSETFADEIAWVAATCFSASCLLSYIAIRREPGEGHFSRWADMVFLSGMSALLISVFVLAATKL